MNLSRRLVLLLILSVPVCARAQTPTTWFGVGLGFTGLEMDIGGYDVFAPHLNGRILLGWPFGAGFNLGADVVWMSENKTGFYTGFGLRLRGDFTGSDYVWFGPAVSLGYDVALTTTDSLYLNTGLGLLFPAYFRQQFPNTNDITVVSQIVSFELGIGYKYKF
jgi:hypothetical protein